VRVCASSFQQTGEPIAVRVRVAAAAASLVLAVAGTACTASNAGAAAFVNGHRVTESDIDQYLSHKATVDIPAVRRFVLTVLIDHARYDAVAPALGGVSATELTAVHDTAVNEVTNSIAQQLFAPTSSGGLGQNLADFGLDPNTAKPDADTLRKIFDHLGITSSLDGLFVNNQATCIVLKICDASTVDAKAQAALAAIKIKVNPRYGSWSTSNGLAGASLPTFIKLPGATPQPTQSAP